MLKRKLGYTQVCVQPWRDRVRLIFFCFVLLFFFTIIVCMIWVVSEVTVLSW